MTEKEPGKTPIKKKRVTINPMDLYVYSIPPYSYSVKKIAELFKIHEVTASNKLSEARTMLEPVFAAQREEIEKIKNNESVALRQPNNKGDSMQLAPGTVPAPPETNPFKELKSFADIIAPSVQAAMVVGSAIGLVSESLNRDLPREQRYEMAGKSGASLFSFTIGILDVLHAMEQKQNKQQITEQNQESE
jgi:hypothetical protein